MALWELDSRKSSCLERKLELSVSNAQWPLLSPSSHHHHQAQGEEGIVLSYRFLLGREPGSLFLCSIVHLFNLAGAGTRWSRVVRHSAGQVVLFLANESRSMVVQNVLWKGLLGVW